MKSWNKVPTISSMKRECENLEHLESIENLFAVNGINSAERIRKRKLLVKKRYTKWRTFTHEASKT